MISCLKSSGDPQKPADIAVIVPTLIRDSLVDAVRSIGEQAGGEQAGVGRIQILVGVDQARGDAKILERAAATLPDHCSLYVLDPGYSTSRRHGGFYAPTDGGALRTILTYLANAPLVAFLDDDNWWGPDHLADLVAAIAGHAWAYSLRWFVDPVEMRPLTVDMWESLGPGRGIFNANFGGWVDPNTLMIDKRICHDIAPIWSQPLPGGSPDMADRHVFKQLSTRYPGCCTGRASSYYVLGLRDINHPVRLQLMAELGIRGTPQPAAAA